MVWNHWLRYSTAVHNTWMPCPNTEGEAKQLAARVYMCVQAMVAASLIEIQWRFPQELALDSNACKKKKKGS